MPRFDFRPDGSMGVRLLLMQVLELEILVLAPSVQILVQEPKIANLDVLDHLDQVDLKFAILDDLNQVDLKADSEAMPDEEYLDPEASRYQNSGRLFQILVESSILSFQMAMVAVWI